MKPLKLGLIGCGGMMHSHAACVHKVEGIEIVAVCDIIRERAEVAADVLNHSVQFFDFVLPVTIYLNKTIIQ